MRTAEAERLAARTPAATALLAALPPRWRRSLFLLERGRRPRPFARAFDGFARTARARLDEAPETRAPAIVRYADLGVEILSRRAAR